MKVSHHVCLLALSALGATRPNAVVGAFAPSTPCIFGLGRHILHGEARRATTYSMSAVAEAPTVAAAPGTKVDGLRFV
jgi:hypothetical protein